jgi:predicted transcriptional regulator
MRTVYHAFFYLIKTLATERCHNTEDASGLLPSQHTRIYLIFNTVATPRWSARTGFGAILESTISKEPLMLANLSVDADLLQTAIDLDTQNTKETIVEAALREYIYHRQQLKEAVMVGAAAADRGDVIDEETAIAALQEKLNAWRNVLN